MSEQEAAVDKMPISSLCKQSSHAAKTSPLSWAGGSLHSLIWRSSAVIVASCAIILGLRYCNCNSLSGPRRPKYGVNTLRVKFLSEQSCLRALLKCTTIGKNFQPAADESKNQSPFESPMNNTAVGRERQFFWPLFIRISVCIMYSVAIHHCFGGLTVCRSCDMHLHVTGGSPAHTIILRNLTFLTILFLSHRWN